MAAVLMRSVPGQTILRVLFAIAYHQALASSLRMQNHTCHNFEVHATTATIQLTLSELKLTPISIVEVWTLVFVSQHVDEMIETSAEKAHGQERRVP